MKDEKKKFRFLHSVVLNKQRKKLQFCDENRRKTQNCITNVSNVNRLQVSVLIIIFYYYEQC